MRKLACAALLVAVLLGAVGCRQPATGPTATPDAPTVGVSDIPTAGVSNAPTLPVAEPTEEWKTETETPGITKVKTVQRSDSPTRFLTRGGVDYTLSEDGESYTAKVAVYENRVVIASYIDGIPVTKIERIYSEKVHSLSLSDRAQELGEISYFSRGSDLWISAEAKKIASLAGTDCSVYFAGKKSDYICTEGDQLFRTVSPDGLVSPYGAKTVVRVTSGNHPDVVTASNFGLGGVYYASCLRYLDEAGNVIAEIPFANALSVVDDASGKMKDYRTAVEEADLLQGVWYYLNDAGEKVRFTFDSIDVTKQQIVSLYRAE